MIAPLDATSAALRSGPAGPYVATVMPADSSHPTTSRMPKASVPPRRGRPRNPRATRLRVKPENLTDPELIARAIKVSRSAENADEPITDREFAERILLCHPRTLRKYLDGRPLPPLAREKLVQIVKDA